MVGFLAPGGGENAPMYAAPNGNPAAAGTLSKPTTLQAALQRIGNGGTIYLRSGTHVINESVTITADNVTIRNYANEHAYVRIDSAIGATHETIAGIVIEGDNVRFRGMDGGILRIGSEPTTRQSEARFVYVDHGAMGIRGVAPDDGTFSGVYIHDLLTVAHQQSGGGCPVDGAVMWNFGHTYTDGADGEFLYIQNPVGSPLKRVRRSLFGQSYGLVMQVYAEATGQGSIEISDILSMSSAAVYMVGWQEWALMRLADSVVYGALVPLGRAWCSINQTDPTRPAFQRTRGRPAPGRLPPCVCCVMVQSFRRCLPAQTAPGCSCNRGRWFWCLLVVGPIFLRPPAARFKSGLHRRVRPRLLRLETVVEF